MSGGNCTFNRIIGMEVVLKLAVYNKEKVGVQG